MPALPIDLRKSCAHGSAESCANCKVRLVSLCAVLTTDELVVMEQMTTHRHFARGQSLADQDEPMASVFTLADGMVRLHKLLPNGRRQIVGFAMPGDFIGLSLAERYEFSAEAVTSVAVCSFDRRAFSGFVDTHPHFLKRLHAFASYELSLAQDQMVVLGRRSAEERVAQFIMGLSARLARLGRVSPTIPLPMTRQDVADYLGLTIETVSRTFTKLARERMIAIIPDGVRLLNAEDLGALAAA